LALLLLPLAFGFTKAAGKLAEPYPKGWLCYCCLWPLVFPAAEQGKTSTAAFAAALGFPGKTSRAIPKGLALLLLPFQQPLVFPALQQQQEN
jgi:hypothetical protein